MYSYIKGKLVHVSTDHIVVDNNGIGYMIFAPVSSFMQYTGEHAEITVYTHFVANENGVNLYGFASMEDKNLFTKMISVSGVGPKAAISILSTLTYRDIIFAVLNDDDKAIARAPGVGPKIARRMILDLKDKLDITEDTLLGISEDDLTTMNTPETGSISDAIAALSALGYAYSDAARAVKSVENAKDLDVESLLSLALKEL